MNLLIIKAGGGAGVDIEAVCRDVAALATAGRPVVLVHGTSSAADVLAQRAGVAVRQLTSPSGHVSRYTDPETLEIYVAAAAGQVNKGIVARLQGLGCNAVGLSGVDGRLLLAERKEAVRAVEAGRQRIVRDDYTGKLVSANGQLLRLLLDAGYTPVIAPLALGAQAERLNVDGDRAAALVAASLGATRLVIGAHEEESAGRARGAGRRRRHRHPGRLARAPAGAGRAGRRGDVGGAETGIPQRMKNSGWSTRTMDLSLLIRNHRFSGLFRPPPFEVLHPLWYSALRHSLFFIRCGIPIPP